MKDNTAENFKNFINTLGEILQKENAEKEIPKLIIDDFYKKNLRKVIKNFYNDFILPVEDRIELKIPEFLYSTELLNMLLINQNILKIDLEKEIINYNKTYACCADESRNIIDELINLLITGEHSSLQETYNDYWESIQDEKEKERLIDFKNNKELTYWSCKRFKDTKEVLEWIMNKYYHD